MNTKNKNLAHVIKLCECAILIALSIVLDFVSKGIFFYLEPFWPAGGGITLCMVPMVFISLRHGYLWGIGSGLVYSGIQMLTGWYTPAGGVSAIVLCVLFDYVIAYSVLGLADLFASFFKNKLLGYGFGAFIVCILRCVCGIISGIAVWGSWIAWESFDNLYLYAIAYNTSYMVPNAIITSIIIVAICSVFNPKTLKKHKAEA